MIRGPEKTPYEDGLFFFDFQLSADYPKAPPLCHYISYCSDRLNPNLYEDGKVCISLLGTWSGKGTEVWTLHSNLLQVIVSIQGQITISLSFLRVRRKCCKGHYHIFYSCIESVFYMCGNLNNLYSIKAKNSIIYTVNFFTQFSRNYKCSMT